MKQATLAALALGLMLSAPVRADDFPLPPDATPIDVTKAPYNAVGDGRTDCTAAFNMALKAGKKEGFDTGGQRLIYVPNGTYLLRCTPEEAEAARAMKYMPGLIGWQGSKKTILHGQSRDGVVLRLMDRCPGFDDPKRPRHVLEAGKAGPQDFSNSVYNITVDTGAGNPAAIGMKFHTSNQGGMFNVLIRSGDPDRVGWIGLDLRGNGPGPQLVKNVRIEGFERGVSIVYDGGFDTVFEHLELVGQRREGFYNEALPCAIRDLRSTNTVPAVRLAGPSAYLALVDAQLSGGAAEGTAVVNEGGCLFARNVAVEGYAAAVRSTVGDVTRTAYGPRLEEFVSHPVRTVVPGAAPASLNLPIEETPEVPWGDVGRWVSVRAFEPRELSYTDSQGREQKITDWSIAVQQAIDSGATTVYFPNGAYRVCDTIHVRGKVQRILGMESHVTPFMLPLEEQDSKPVFRIEDGEGPVVLERLRSGYGGRSGPWYEHASTRTLVLRQTMFGGYANTVPGGKVFIEDVCAGNLAFAGQKVWIRQINPEAKGGENSFNLRNVGSDLWILGVKTEGPKTVITTTDGGRTELLGCQLYPNRGTEGDPAFVCDGGVQSLTYVCEQGWISPDALYEEQVRETRGAETYSLWRGACFARGPRDRLGGGLFVPLYSSRPAEPAPAEAATPALPSAFCRADPGRTGAFATKALRRLAGSPAAGADQAEGPAEGQGAEEGKGAEENEVAKEGEGAERTAGELFRFKTDKGAWCPVVAGGVVYFGDRWGRFYALDADTGAEKWRFQAAGFCGAPVVAGGVVAFGSGTEFLALEADTGRERWRFQTRGLPYFAPLALGDTIVFASQDGFVYAADAETGFERWRFRAERDIAGDLAADRGRVFVGERGGVQALDLATGREVWHFTCGASVIYPIASGGVVYVPAENIFALDAWTGRELWAAKVFEPTDPRLALAGGRLYAGASRADGVYVFDAATGILLKTIRFKYHKYNWSAAIHGPPVYADGVLYFSMMHSWALAAVDVETDQPLWIKWGGFFQAPFVHDGRVYLGDGGGLVVLGEATRKEPVAAKPPLGP